MHPVHGPAGNALPHLPAIGRTKANLRLPARSQIAVSKRVRETAVRLIAGSIRNPIAIGVAVLLICLFGALSLKQLPLQLFPDIERPTISIFTNWRGASPEEVEAELLEPQEQVLQGLPGVEEINGNAGAGGSQVFLTFAIGTDMKSALVDVIGRMSRLPPLPRDVDRPIVQLGGADGDSNQNLSFFFVQLLPGTEGPIERYRRLIEDVVKPRIESVPGVALVNINGGPPDDVRITVDLARAAALGIGIPDIARQAASATNVSAGQLDVGRRQYALRYTGRYEAEDLGQLVLAWREGQPVRMADVATIELRPPDRQFFSLPEWQPGDRSRNPPRTGRQRADHARRSEESRRRTARRPAQGPRPWHRAILRCFAVHSSRSQSADRESGRRRDPRAGVRVVVHARQARDLY